MTIKEVNKIFKSKYPEGEIIQRGNFLGRSKVSIAVQFKPNGKIYEYNADSYANLLQRLGFKVAYKTDFLYWESQIEAITARLKAGGEENLFADDNNGWWAYSESEILMFNNELNRLKENLVTYVLVNG